jgi:hypothetical protein
MIGGFYLACSLAAIFLHPAPAAAVTTGKLQFKAEYFEWEKRDSEGEHVTGFKPLPPYAKLVGSIALVGEPGRELFAEAEVGEHSLELRCLVNKGIIEWEPGHGKTAGLGRDYQRIHAGMEMRLSQPFAMLATTTDESGKTICHAFVLTVTKLDDLKSVDAVGRSDP